MAIQKQKIEQSIIGRKNQKVSRPTRRDLIAELEGLGNALQAELAKRFFKTGKGQYGEGDRFRGIRVPVLRQLAKRYIHLGFQDVTKLLSSSFHEDRLVALVIAVNRAKCARKKLSTRSPKIGKIAKRISKVTLKQNQKPSNPYLNADFEGHAIYLDGVRNFRINNWDLVDVIAEHLIGAQIEDQKSGGPTRQGLVLLRQLARSDNLWERRTAILSTFAFLRKGHTATTIEIAESLCQDSHDLMHKAVGWLMREVGKKDLNALRSFLTRYAETLPRTLLRYAIERMSDTEKQKWMRFGNRSLYGINAN